MTDKAASTNNNKLPEQVDDNNFTEEELANLTDEEREALDLDESEDKTEDKTEDESESESNDEPEDEPESESEGELNDGKDDDSADADSNEDEASKDDDVESLVEVASVDAKAKVDGDSYTEEAYRDDMKSLTEKHQDGDIEDWEFEASKNDLNFNYNQARQNEINANAAAADAAASWEADQAAFFAATKKFAENTILNGALNAVIQDIEASGEGAGLNGAQLLHQAAIKVNEAFESVADKKEVSASNEPVKRPRPKKSDKQMPESLGDIPAASDSDSGEKGLFDKLDSLDGEALEDAVAALSTADKVRYEKML